MKIFSLPQKANEKSLAKEYIKIDYTFPKIQYSFNEMRIKHEKNG